ncbi:DUF2336 domain-containing protein [Pseudorhodoplanes sinuspersici]|uniref:Uncharacterized protein n=1 Tax=Pseudorhodoplanes sinuspersici TaxID=1235591 RepID=A0A1W6ZPS3_9HYPH|nr:DUF2336 domain-containing protein [Pseudorhodoplanes sinuspersici]ARP99237.1 hypothetical protein CAK95_09165 [Pseudorhodoplanes sinuspersici]RKE69094.1 uncharacterized protein (DUF2336 family) [Pseudorhodoplanes sinuspersici]
MAAPFSMIPGLESVVKEGSGEKRAQALRQITTLFVDGSGRFNAEHIRLFEDVFLMLINEIEGKALVELSRQLAPMSDSPVNVVRRLAKDDDIMIAGPMLAQSPRLVTADLVDIASTKSIDHLYAISGRLRIEEPVTDIIVRRGDLLVKRKLAGNAGARLSDSGFTALLRSAEHDSLLAEAVALRTDIPDHLFRELLTRATDVVRQRLLANAKPEIQAHIRSVLAKVSDEVARKPMRDFSDAQQQVRILAQAGELTEEQLANFARSREYDSTVAALSELTEVPIDVVERLMNGDRPDPILILCKAAGYSWPTVRNIIQARLGTRGKAVPTLEAAHSNFDKLSAATAQRVVRFWQLSPGSIPAAI